METRGIEASSLPCSAGLRDDDFAICLAIKGHQENVCFGS